MLAKISEDLGDVKKKEEYMSNPWGKRKRSKGFWGHFHDNMQNFFLVKKVVC